MAKYSIFEELGSIRRYWADTGLRYRALLVPTAILLTASVFEGISLTLLIPLINLILDKDATLLSKVSVPEPIRQLLPTSYWWSVAGLLIAATVTAICKNLLQYWGNLRTSYLVRTFSGSLRSLIYSRYLGFGKLFFDNNSFGYLHQVIITYTTLVAGVLQSVQWAIYCLSTLLVYFVLMACISWKLTSLLLIVFPILYYALAWLIAKIAMASRAHTETYNLLGRKISNAISCIILVKAYNNETDEINKFRHTSETISEMQYGIDKKSLLIAPLQEIILLLVLFCLICVISILVRNNVTLMAQFTVFVLMLRRSISLFGTFNGVKSALAAVSGPIAEINKILSDENKHIFHGGEKAIEEFKEVISFADLSFTYPSGTLALSSLNLSFKKGQATAIVGQSGSGKSTIVNLLMRFYDCPSGTIFVDGIDIREFSVKSWRDKIALVSQDTMLLNGSLKANLLYGIHRQVSEETLLSAIENARLHDFVCNLPDGLDTEIGDRGVKLSGGEKQRVAIARALLKDAEILLLDEATSSLDSVTELMIQEALDRIIKGRTTIIVAHRLSTIRCADKIVVIEKGRVVEEGTFHNLLSREGQFVTYWANQQLN